VLCTRTYLWLAETSQQPTSQTTWLKITPHCNHCKHCMRTCLARVVLQNGGGGGGGDGGGGLTTVLNINQTT